MLSKILVALFCAIVAPVVAQTTSVPPSSAVPPAPSAGTGIYLSVARSGNEIMLAWELPPLEIRQFEIYRNVIRDTKGRVRAGSVRTTPALFLDTVPEMNVVYWYWLKITLMNGQEINHGPIPTPAPDIWMP